MENLNLLRYLNDHKFSEIKCYKKGISNGCLYYNYTKFQVKLISMGQIYDLPFSIMNMSRKEK